MKFSTVLSAATGFTVVYAAECPAPGMTDTKGDKGCDPSKEYPGQACALIGDCNILRGLGGVVPTSSAPGPKPTTACPEPGKTDANGDEGCDPTKEYPGQACALIGECNILRGLGLATTTSAPGPKPTVACPEPGKTAANGDVGCDPKKEYPGEACALIGECYALRGLGGMVPTSGNGPAPTHSDPAPTHSNGASATHTNGVAPTHNGGTPAQTTTPGQTTGSAGRLSAGVGLAAVAFFVMLL